MEKQGSEGNQVPQVSEFVYDYYETERNITLFGAAFVGENKIAMYGNSYFESAKADNSLEVTLNLEDKKTVSETKFNRKCLICNNHQAAVGNVVVHGDYYLVLERCTDQGCHHQFTGRDDQEAFVVVARKRSDPNHAHFIYAGSLDKWDGRERVVEIYSNDQIVAIQDKKNKKLLVQGWDQILKSQKEPSLNALESKTPEGAQVLTVFLEGADFGYLTSSGETKIPGIPGFQLPKKEHQQCTWVHKVSDTRVAAIFNYLIDNEAEKPISDLYLLDNQGHELSKLAGKFTGWRATDSNYGYDQGEDEPFFQKVFKVTANVLLVIARHTFLHFVHLHDDKLTQIGEKKEVFYERPFGREPVFDWQTVGSNSVRFLSRHPWGDNRADLFKISIN